MESITPSLDTDLPLPPSHSPLPMSFPPSSSSPTVHSHLDSQSAHATPAPPSSAQQKFSNGPHIRSRITVVCAECKRLKLKCDRRTPCSSCIKRDTLPRCIYSQAAAEKIDVQTLHNRIIEIERVIAQYQAAPSSLPSSTTSAGLQNPKQPAPVAGPSRAGPSLMPSTSALLAGLPCNDRALLAQGASGSSVVINYEDVVSLWLNELEDFAFDCRSPRMSSSDATSSPMRPSTSSATVKLEPSPVSIPPASTSFSPGNGAHAPVGGLHHTLHPPVSYDVFLPSPPTGPSTLPQVTPALISYLPSEPARSRYLKAFRETMLLHPSFNVPHFEQRIAAIYTWADSGEATSSNTVPAYGNRPMSKQELARDIFFSTAKPGSTSTSTSGRATASSNANAPKPTLSFFAAASAAFALGSLVARDEEPERADPPSVPSPPGAGDVGPTPAMMFALSEQAMQLFEKTAAYDLDSVITMILQVLYMLHEGQMSIAQSVFPMVGKMVNIARQMGLAMDPDEFPGTYNLFEAETRRRIWWDVCFYDLFVSDAMGQPPLIADNSHTTRLASDVDEEKFTPSCTSFPHPENVEGDSSSIYFTLKCRIAQLVKNIKKQTFRDPIHDEGCELSIDQAGTLEGEVNAFLQDLPAGFRLETTEDISKPLPPPPSSSSESPIRLAQKCELAVLANRVVVKLYLPFLKEAAATQRPAHQAVFGTVNAAHNVVHAARVLHSVWGRTRPAMFDFYDFGRTLFDAGVVCAHAVIREPMNIVAGEALKSVACAAEILKEMGASSSAARIGVEGARAEAGRQKVGGGRSEAARIIEWMKARAEAARSGGAMMTATGSKRKHSEVEAEVLLPGLAASTSGSGLFQLPFVGAAVSSTRSERTARPRTGAREMGNGGEARGKGDGNGNGNGKKQAKDKDREKDKEKDKEKEKAPKYAGGALRMRAMTGQPAPRRQRTASVSTSTVGTSGSRTAGAAPPPSPLTTTTPPGAGTGLGTTNTNAVQVQVPVQIQQVRASASASASVPQSPSVQTSAYEVGYPSSSRMSVAPESMHQHPPPPPPPPPPGPPQQQQQQQQDDYTMQYSSPDEGMSDDRRFSGQSNYDDSPPSGTTMYDGPQYAHPSPATPSYPPPAASWQVQAQANYDIPYPTATGTGAGAGAGAGTTGAGTGTTTGYEAHTHSSLQMNILDASPGASGTVAPAMTALGHEQHQHPHPHQHQQQHQQHYMQVQEGPKGGHGHHAYHARGMEYSHPVPPPPPPTTTTTPSQQHQHQQQQHQQQHQHHHAQAQASQAMVHHHHVQSWVPGESSPEMWPDYKYYGGMNG